MSDRFGSEDPRHSAEMAQKEFILQGFTPRTHAAAVREIFDLPKIQRVILSVAYVTEGGVDLLKSALAKHATKATVFAGIRNESTTGQALIALHRIGLELYTVDTGFRQRIFHPKLYLVRSSTQARLVVGSANLTLGGLNNNIEAGMLLDFDLADAHDKAVVDGIEAQLGALPSEHPEHVVKVTKKAQIDEMLESGLVADEIAIPPPHPSTAAQSGAKDTVSGIKLKVAFLRKPMGAGAVQKKPSPKQPAKPKSGTDSQPVPVTIGVQFELMWESKELTRRDLTIPTASGTHQTGSINLDKGLLDQAVDHRPYFRQIVFDSLAWTPAASTATEEAYAKFQLVLKGVSYGEFDLRIGHSTSTSSKSYLQNNAMTRLSWGPMRKYISKPDLIGRTLALYRDQADPTRFMLEID
jgi:HKD family nuclease